MGWVWLIVPLRVCGYHGNGEEKLRVVEELGHLNIYVYESCVSISPFRWWWSNGPGLVGLAVPRRKVKHPENVCGGCDVELGLVKIVGISEKAH